MNAYVCIHPRIAFSSNKCRRRGSFTAAPAHWAEEKGERFYRCKLNRRIVTRWTKSRRLRSCRCDAAEAAASLFALFEPFTCSAEATQEDTGGGTFINALTDLTLKKDESLIKLQSDCNVR